MNKIKKFMIGTGSSIAYAIITAIFTIVPDDCFKYIGCFLKYNEVINGLIIRSIITFTVFILANFFFYLYKHKRQSVSLIGRNYSIKIEYGDLLSITDGYVVINFDECFTTSVGDKPSDIKPMSLCGQYLTKHHIDNMQELLVIANVKPARRNSLFNRKDCYEPGTIVPNGKYLLMAFSKLDKNGLGHLTYDEYLKCLDTLWEQLDLYHGTSDVYIPVLGANITRFDKELSQQELLDTIISSYRLSPKKMKKLYTLHIVCKELEGFSLNDVFGVG